MVNVVEPGSICTLCAGFDDFALPSFTNCYLGHFDDYVRNTALRRDFGHLAFRFLVGPSSTEEIQDAEDEYRDRYQILVEDEIEFYID